MKHRDDSHRDDHRKDPRDHSREQTKATEAKEVDAMYESEGQSNEERELERLFAADPESEGLPTPPPDLADRIKAEIPADLGWTSTGSDSAADEGGTVVPFWRHPRTLALAATLLLTVSLGILMQDRLVPDVPDEASSADSAQPAEAPAIGSVERDAPSTERRGDEVAEARPAEPELASADEITAARDAEGGSADAAADGRVSARGRRVPMPDPTPDEPEAVRQEAAESDLVVNDSITVTGENVVMDMSKTRAGSTVGGAPPPPARPAPHAPASPPPVPKPPSVAERYQKLEETAVMDRESPSSPSLLKPDASLQPPNDEAYDAMYFESAGVNPFVDTEDDALSTFGLDVDTASYTVARRYLEDGNLPPRDAVRVEEMLNYFDYGDAPPRDTGSQDDFALHAEVAPSRWAPDGNRSERYYLVRFGLRARDVLATERPPALLTFVVDVSGSMAREDRLGLVKRSLGLLLEHLRDDDRVALVVYGSQGRVLMEPTSDKEVVHRAIERLVPEGSTNAAEGLRLGYELTARHRRPGHIHRVVLCSDGVANVGTTTSGEGILGEVERWGKQGVELTTVGFGMGNYNDTLMETLADQGNGRYAYVDTLDEARRIFVDDLTGTLTTVAAEARAQVAFDPEVVSRYRLLGYENRDIADERFRDDTVDAGEIGAGHAVTALYEVKTRRPLRSRDDLATLTLRYASVARGEMVEQSRQVTGRDAAGSFAEAPAALRLAATVAEFAEVLRGSYWARDVDLGEVFDEARRVAADWRGDDEDAAELVEFASLVGRAQRVSEQRLGEQLDER